MMSDKRVINQDHQQNLVDELLIAIEENKTMKRIFNLKIYKLMIRYYIIITIQRSPGILKDVALFHRFLSSVHRSQSKISLL